MTTREGVAVIGAGGQSKVVIATLLEAGQPVGAVFDDRPDTWGTSVLGIEVVGSVDDVERKGYGRALIGIGDNRARKAVAERFDQLEWLCAVHPSAVVHPSVVLDAGTVVFAGAVIQPDTRIGRHCIINTGATVDHDCIIGDYAHVAPGAHLAGQVRLGEGVMMGAGSAAIPSICIGSWTVVGAGGVVIRDLPPGITAVGMPAKSRDGRD